jgi:hypothetical protein
MTKVTIIIFSKQNYDFINKIEFETNINLDLLNITLCGLYLSNIQSINGIEELLNECDEHLASLTDLDLTTTYFCIVYGLQIIQPGSEMEPLLFLTQIDKLLAVSLNLCKDHVDPTCFMTKQVYGWRKKILEDTVEKIKSDLLSDLSDADMEVTIIQIEYRTNKITKEECEEKIRDILKSKRNIVKKSFDEVTKIIQMI